MKTPPRAHRVTRAARTAFCAASLLFTATQTSAQDSAGLDPQPTLDTTSGGLDSPPDSAPALDPTGDEPPPEAAPTAANPDPFANESFRPLLIVRNASVRLTELRAQPFFELLGLSLRYGLLPAAPGDGAPAPWRGESLALDPQTLSAILSGDESAAPGGASILSAARSWCRTATTEMQESRGATDLGATMEALTTDAIQERCSQILDLEINVESADDAICQQGDRCTINLQMTLRRFLVSFDQEGNYIWRSDSDFGNQGAFSYNESFTVVRPPVPSIRLFGNDVTRNFNAYGLAARTAALAAQRTLQEIPQLQVRALVAAVLDGDVRFCGSAEDILLDTPFHVRFMTSDGPQDAGFVVARDLSDGCSMTSTLLSRETEANQSVDLRPSSAQILIGGDSIRPGMTLWQMPSVGLNFVTSLGTTPSIMIGTGGDGEDWGSLFVNFFQPTLTLGAEYNFGRYIGASETWVAFNVELGGDLGYGNSTSFYGAERARPDAGFFVRPELGILKRFFTGGRFFVELGAYAHYSVMIPLSADASLEYGIPMTVGGRVEFGLGWQTSPRTQFHIGLGGRGGFAWADAGASETATGVEFGPVAKMGLSYAF